MRRVITCLPTVVALTAWASVVHADDLPTELTARPATLPRHMIAMSATTGYDSAHVLGVSTLSATTLVLGVPRGMTSRLELALATGIAIWPDPAWTQESAFGLTYHAWSRGSLELAPSVAVPLLFDRGPDLTSTIAFGAGLRWHATPSVLFTFGRRLVPVPIRPAVALDVAADAAVVGQLTQQLAIGGELGLGEATLVGQTDRGVAPWHHLPASVRLVYATLSSLDVALEIHGDLRDPRNRYGAALAITRRM